MGSFCRNSARDMHACPSGLLDLRTGFLVVLGYGLRSDVRVRVGVGVGMLMALRFCHA